MLPSASLLVLNTHTHTHTNTLYSFSCFAISSHPSLAPLCSPNLSPFLCLSLSSTGTTSRRCSLDHRGMAFWEQPSYARCITNEFRYLQQSVGAKSAPSHSLCLQRIINYTPTPHTHTHTSPPSYICRHSHGLVFQSFCRQKLTTTSQAD